MSDLLREWLRRNGVEVACGRFEQIFANGYVFGRVAQRFGLQPDFEYFKDSREPVAIVDNYERLYPTFLALGIAFNSKLAERLMNEDVGVASNVLNAFRQALAKHQRRRVGSDENIGLSREFCQIQSYRSVKDAFYTSEARSFRDTLDRTVQEKTRRQIGIETSEDIEQLEKPRYQEHELSKHGTSTNASVVRNPAVKKGPAKRRVRIATAIPALARMKTSSSSEKHIECVTDGDCDIKDEIRRFEDKQEVQRIDDCNIATSKEQLLEFASEYMDAIRRRQEKTKEMEAEEEEAAYLGTAYVEAAYQECIEEQQQALDEALLETLGRLSSEEAKICEKLESTRAEEGLIKENVARRRSERQRQRAAAEEAIIKQELVLFRQIKADLQGRFENLQECRKRKEEKLKEINKIAARQECKDISWSLIRLSELRHEYKVQVGESSIPHHIRNKWHETFVSNNASLRVFRLERDQIPDEALEAFIRSDVENYVNHTKDWEPTIASGADHQFVGNHRLAEWIGTMASESHARKQESQMDSALDVTKFNLRLAVIGPPCSGRTTVSAHLQSLFGITILSPETDSPTSNRAQHDNAERQEVDIFEQIHCLIADAEKSQDTIPGFVLNGYPVTQSAAVDLEKRLTKLNLEAEEELISAASKLLPPPAELLPDMNRKLLSGLDAVFFLDVQSTEQLLERATEKEISKRPDPKKGKTKETTLPQEDLEILAKKIDEQWTQHRQQAAELRSWFSRFEGLLVDIDASSPKTVVLSAVEAHVRQIVDAKESSRQSAETAVIAQTTLHDVKQAEIAAQETLLSIQDIAKEIIVTKKAEILATDNLGKNQNERNRKTLQTETSKLLTGVYLKAQNCLEELEKNLQSAQKATEEIQASSHHMMSAQESAAMHVESANTIKTNYESVLELKHQCEDACSKALQASQEAAHLISEVKKSANEIQSDEELKELEHQVTSTPSLASAEKIEEDLCETASPSIRLPSSWDDTSIHDMHQMWQDLESAYFASLTAHFRAMHEDLFYFLHRCLEAKIAFLKTLKADDRKQAEVDTFVEAFNATDAEDRGAFRDQWISRCETFQTALWKLCDENTAVQEGQLEQQFQQKQFQIELSHKMQNIHIDLIQTEVSRFLRTVLFCIAYAAWNHDDAEGLDRDQILTLSSLEIRSSEQPKAVQQLINSKKELCFPAWIDDLDGELVEIRKALRCALAAVEVIKRDLAETTMADTKSGTGKKPTGTVKAATMEMNPLMLSIKASIKQIAEIEADGFCKRMESILCHLKTTLHEMDSTRSSTKKACYDALADRHRQDCADIAVLVEHLKAHVMQGTNMTIAADGRLLPTDTDPDSTAVKDLEIPAIWMDQLSSNVPVLGQKFTALGDGNVVRIEQAAKCIYESCIQECNAAMHPASMPDHPASPIPSHPSRFDDIMQFLSRFDLDNTGYINWTRLLSQLQTDNDQDTPASKAPTLSQSPPSPATDHSISNQASLESLASLN